MYFPRCPLSFVFFLYLNFYFAIPLSAYLHPLSRFAGKNIQFQQLNKQFDFVFGSKGTSSSMEQKTNVVNQVHHSSPLSEHSQHKYRNHQSLARLQAINEDEEEDNNENQSNRRLSEWLDNIQKEYVSPLVVSFQDSINKVLQSNAFIKSKRRLQALIDLRSLDSKASSTVLVFGATGKLGREIVMLLLEENYDVIAAVRNETKAEEIFYPTLPVDNTGKGKASRNGSGRIEALTIKGGIDVTDLSTLSPDLFQGVSHVVSALGPVGGPKPGGGFGFLEGLTSEDVDYKGVKNIIDSLMKRNDPKRSILSSASNSIITAETISTPNSFKEVKRSPFNFSPAKPKSSATSKSTDYIPPIRKENATPLQSLPQAVLEQSFQTTLPPTLSQKEQEQNQKNENKRSTKFTLSDFTGLRPLYAYGWEETSDAVMGGRSISRFQLLSGEETCAEFSGRVIVEGGGFCGARGDMDELALMNWDGILLNIKGDGNRYKLNLRTKLKDGEEVLYQTSFQTIEGEGSVWQDIFLPFESFVPVIRNTVQYNKPKLEAGSGFTLLSMSLIYSRFEYNRAPNPTFSRAPFRLRIKSISAYRNERPVFVLVSSAGAERNARIMDEKDRKDEIPIVQLNPGGILNWKYKGEDYLRNIGQDSLMNEFEKSDLAIRGKNDAKLPYTIIRPCGLVMSSAFSAPEKIATLEASQGDVMSGRLTRKDVAKAVVASLVSPSATYCTLEVRRSETEADQGKDTNWNKFFGTLVKDYDRVLEGLWPLPLAVDPPPPVTSERAKEILNDPRVKAQQQRDGVGGDGQSPVLQPTSEVSKVSSAGAPNENKNANNQSNNERNKSKMTSISSSGISSSNGSRESNNRKSQEQQQPTTINNFIKDESKDKDSKQSIDSNPSLIPDNTVKKEDLKSAEVTDSKMKSPKTSSLVGSFDFEKYQKATNQNDALENSKIEKSKDSNVPI